MGPAFKRHKNKFKIPTLSRLACRTLVQRGAARPTQSIALFAAPSGKINYSFSSFFKFNNATADGTVNLMFLGLGVNKE
jgi:hypothetical protein